MKMFGMQDVATTVVARHEAPDHKYVPLPSSLSFVLTLRSFFRFCLINLSKNPQPQRGPPANDDYMSISPRRTVTRTTTLPNGNTHEEEIDMLTEFSWRNFFATINFAKIMQKLSKNRAHRIRMLVQYKSTVCVVF